LKESSAKRTQEFHYFLVGLIVGIIKQRYNYRELIAPAERNAFYKNLRKEIRYGPKN
jgi:hypothetical protein